MCFKLRGWKALGIFQPTSRRPFQNTFGGTDESFAKGHSTGLQIVVCTINIHMTLASSNLKGIKVSACSCVELVDDRDDMESSDSFYLILSVDIPYLFYI